jgi:hypothetical protein
LHEHRINPARNMLRFYRLDVQPDVFGGFAVARERGRIGARGRMADEWRLTETQAPPPCSAGPSARGGVATSSPFGAATRQRDSRNGALWNFPAITPLGGICTWKSGAAASRFCPETRPELGFPVVPKTLLRVSTLM